MIAADKLLELSSINGCATAAQHFCSITQTGGENVIRTFGEYLIEYIAETIEKIEYVVQDVLCIEYIDQDHTENIIEYIPDDSLDIAYINNEITIEQICDK